LKYWGRALRLLKPRRGDRVFALNKLPEPVLSAEEWISALRAGWSFSTAEVEVLKIAAAARDRFLQSQAQIDADGLTFQDRWNQTRADPLLNTERDARASYLNALRVLKFVESDSDLVRLADRRRRVRRA
jgi:hypothetical protein